MSNQTKKNRQWNGPKANWNIKGLLLVLPYLIRFAEDLRNDKRSDTYEIDGISSIPLIIGALAAELSLKTIIDQEGESLDGSRTHDLKKLYCKISCETRKQIERLWSSPSSDPQILRKFPIEMFGFGTIDVNRVGIDRVLEKHSKTFIEWRYLPECRGARGLSGNPYELAYAAWTLYKFHVDKTDLPFGNTSGVARV